MVIFQTNHTKNGWQSYIFQCNTIHFLSLLVRPRRCEFQRLRLLNFGTALESSSAVQLKRCPQMKSCQLYAAVSNSSGEKSMGFDRLDMACHTCHVSFFAVVSGAKNLGQGCFLESQHVSNMPYLNSDYGLKSSG